MISAFAISQSVRATAAAIAIVVCCAIPVASQSIAGTGAADATIQPVASAQAGALSGSVQSGPATDQVLQLTLQDAMGRGLQYNLGSIETGEDVRTARGERLLALSGLLPHVTAFLNLNAAREQVAVAPQNVTLANENLGRAKDRFTSGVSNSVEVVQAEQALASANDRYISSLYDHNLAKLSLARALEVARTEFLASALLPPKLKNILSKYRGPHKASLFNDSSLETAA